MKVIRLCEHQSLPLSGLSEDQKQTVETALVDWQSTNDQKQSPLSFRGRDGNELKAEGWVGIVETADIRIEVFPKLDKRLIAEERCIEEESVIGSVLNNLLWLMETAEADNYFETGEAGTKDAPASYYDLLAALFAGRLLPELEAGVAHAYQTEEDDLRAVRGRLDIFRQISRNFNRMDRIACRWDEFTPDIPINRLLRRVCDYLLNRVTWNLTRERLELCMVHLEEVSQVSNQEALSSTRFMRWDRTRERFRTVYEFGRRLLEGISQDTSHGESTAFVFLVDMAELFERYVQSLLTQRFGGCVQKVVVGTLFQNGQVQQECDFLWKVKGVVCIGDAKYKYLTRNLVEDSLSFSDLKIHRDILIPDDVRQLTVYAELAKRKYGSSAPIMLMLRKPPVNTPSAVRADVRFS